VYDKLINRWSLNKINNLDNKIYVEPDRTSPNKLTLIVDQATEPLKLKEIPVEQVTKHHPKIFIAKKIVL
jgi:hypothetical protein